MTSPSRSELGAWLRRQGYPRDEEHCPNCGQPASSLFHATWNLEKCPYWLFGRWVMRSDFTEADEAELARQRGEES